MSRGSSLVTSQVTNRSLFVVANIVLSKIHPLNRIAPSNVRFVPQFIGVLSADTLIHTGDLARATGGDERLDQDLVNRALTAMTPMAADLSRSGAFAAAIDLPADADPQTRLLGMTGRRA